MKKEDKEFLRELQHELNMQSNEANADPVIWGVMESVEQIVPADCGDETVACAVDSHYNLQEFIEYVKEYYIDDEEDEDVLHEWEQVDKNNISDIADFVNNHYEAEIELCDIDYQDRIARGTGSFLTKRAAQEYVRRYGYNHRNPRAWSMCAYRNFELERLLNILKSMNVDDIKED